MSRRKRAVVSPSCRRSPEKLKVTYEPTGEYHTLPDLARITGVGVDTLRNRWRRAGRPLVVTEALAAPVGAGFERRGVAMVDYSGHGLIPFRKVVEIHSGGKKSLSFYRDRWRRAGSPQKVSAELFDPLPGQKVPKVYKPKAHPKPDQSAIRATPGIPYDPSLPPGDLAHLNGDPTKPNTGAGRGEIPDAEWIRMRSPVRSSLANCFQLQAEGRSVKGMALTLGDIYADVKIKVEAASVRSPKAKKEEEQHVGE